MFNGNRAKNHLIERWVTDRSINFMTSFVTILIFFLDIEKKRCEGLRGMGWVEG